MFNFKKKGRKKWFLCEKTSFVAHKTKRGEQKGAVINFLPFIAHLKAECMKSTCKFVHSSVIIFSKQYSFASKFITEICFLVFFVCFGFF